MRRKRGRKEDELERRKLEGSKTMKKDAGKKTSMERKQRKSDRGRRQ